jgi:hypothetical protein
VAQPQGEGHVKQGSQLLLHDEQPLEQAEQPLPHEQPAPHPQPELQDEQPVEQAEQPHDEQLLEHDVLPHEQVLSCQISSPPERPCPRSDRS